MISEEERSQYLKIMGRKGLKMLSIISSLREVIDKIDTQPFKDILTDDIQVHADLFNKIYDALIRQGRADPMDIMRLQVRHEHIIKVADALMNLEKTVEHVHITVKNGTDKKIA